MGDIRAVDEQGKLILFVDGLELQRFRSSSAKIDQDLYVFQWENTPELPPAAAAPSHYLIVSDNPAAAESLSAQLADQQTVCRISAALVPLDLQEPLQGVIFLATDATIQPPATAEAHSARLLGLVQTLGPKEWQETPRLWVVTVGAQSVLPGEPAAPALTALWGLAGSIAHEFPEWRCTRIDLGTIANSAALGRELLAGQTDPIALRGKQRFVAHLTHLSLTHPNDVVLEQAASAAERPFKVEISHPGNLDSLELRAYQQPRPLPGQVVIETSAAGLNFIDVMKAMGIYPGVDPKIPAWIGLECAGTVVALAENPHTAAQHLAIGQEVIAFAPNSFGRFVTADAHLVVPKPTWLSFEAAAALPVVYLTAHYALNYLGRMRRGERVLIHSAAGGVGLAAVQLAKHAGAEIFATAGSTEKRAYLRSLGIAHVLDSRTLDFADQIMEITGGKGVDLVLNSLTGEAISKSLAILAPYGRFLEIGKRDIFQNTRIGLLPFQKNLSYFAIDLDRIARERPAFLGEMFAEVMALFQQQSIAPLPITVFPVTQTVDAIHHFSQPNHIGKIIVSMLDKTVAILPDRQDSPVIKPDATYLITGGLGALGLAVAGWLAKLGARNLALVGRSGAEQLSTAAQAALDELRALGVNLSVLSADISQRDQAAGVIAHIQQHQPPLRGVIHAAGVLADGILMQQSVESFQKVFAPKVSGAWQLHELTLGQPLDFFVLFSSVAAALGSPGQGNYAAANAFMDGLAYYRQALNLPATSINWGPWGQIGLAAQRQQGGLQGLSGLTALAPEVGLEIFGRLLEFSGPQVIVTGLNVGEWQKAHPSAARSTLFARLAAEVTPEAYTASPTMRGSLLAAQPGRPRRAMLEAFIQEQAAQVLRMKLSRVDLHKPLRTLGMDSLMSIEFRNRLESSLDVTLSATLVWNYPTVNDIVPLLAEKLAISLDSANEPVPAEVVPAAAAMAATPAPTQPVSPELNDLTDDELSARLKDELDAIDDLL